ncbi:type II secretion system protein [Methylocella sp.]|uniref:type II secretion system protein n=1 Tax=Methylocella sp. TaxID=1978226 RepID=UPI0037849C0E
MPRKRASDRAAPEDGGAAGFLLVEALVALAVVGVCLAAIGALAAASQRSVRQVEERLALTSALRKVEAALPDRAALDADLSGEINGLRYAVTSRPAADPFPPPDPAGPPPKTQPAWAPRKIAIRVTAPSGAVMEVESLRLTPLARPDAAQP